MKTLLIAAIVSSIDQQPIYRERRFAPTRKVHDYCRARQKHNDNVIHRQVSPAVLQGLDKKVASARP